MRVHVALVSLFSVVAFTVSGQTGDAAWTLKGCLVDRTNDDPLMYASVSVLGTGDTTTADAQGCFTLNLHADPSTSRLTMRIAYLGFEVYTCRIKPKDLDRVRIHRIKRRKFARDVAAAKIKSLEERLAVLK